MATIKGKWIFDEYPTATFIGTVGYTASINFIYDGKPYRGIELTMVTTMSGYWKHCDLAFVSPDFNEENYAYLYIENGWGEHSRIIDFGETEQEMDDEFFHWFSANANQTIDGVWEFNDVISI